MVDDPRTYLTVADQRAQKVIIAGLRAAFGDAIDVVGEEDEEEDIVPDDGATAASPPPPTALPPTTPAATASASAPAPASSATATAKSGSYAASYSIPVHLVELAAEDVCVFVDPVDGTREFVKGRIEAVQCLIGIAYRGRPIVRGIARRSTNHRPAISQCALLH